MQYEARGRLDEKLDQEFIAVNAAKVVSDYADDLPDQIIAGLVTERLEGYLVSEYLLWCKLNDEEPVDGFPEDITEIVGNRVGQIESAVSELGGSDSTSRTSSSSSTSGSTSVFDT